MTMNKTKIAAAGSMKRNGKSFWFASLFLPRRVASDAARLYAFCRTMDDLADLAGTESKCEELAKVREDLRLGTSSNPDVIDFLALARDYQLPLGAADHLIATFLQDATTQPHLADETALARYCYGVGGTVGLMMSPILGADLGCAAEAAVHLGIAMQMTNIARDVLEDAMNGRRYLPGCWVQHVTAQQMIDSSSLRPEIASAVERLLELADRYYASAALGFPMIPTGARKGIEIAAAVYREIGSVLRRGHGAWWRGRVAVSAPRKLWIVIQVYLGLSPLRQLATHVERTKLSLPLAGLPGAP